MGDFLSAPALTFYRSWTAQHSSHVPGDQQTVSPEESSSGRFGKEKGNRKEGLKLALCKHITGAARSVIPAALGECCYVTNPVVQGCVQSFPTVTGAACRGAGLRLGQSDSRRHSHPPSCEIRLNSACQRGSFGAKNPVWHLGAMTAFGPRWEMEFPNVPGCDPGGTSHPCPGPSVPSLGRALQTSEARQAPPRSGWGCRTLPTPRGGAAATQLQVTWVTFQRVPQGPASPNDLTFQKKIKIHIFR